MRAAPPPVPNLYPTFPRGGETTAPVRVGEGPNSSEHFQRFPEHCLGGPNRSMPSSSRLGHAEKADSRNTAGQNNQSDPNGSRGCMHNEIRREPQSRWEKCAQDSR